ncbi:MAG: hypothetical protein AB1938_10715 [Myxococcota bacterium]
MRDVQADLAARLEHMVKTARMWGSPEELETAAQHVVHVWLSVRTPGWTFEQTHALWAEAGGPFAQDADEHAVMRSKMWREEEALARMQVVAGFATVWSMLDREPSREAAVGPWLERLLDEPGLAGTPDRLNMVLFTLMGFVARTPERFVEALKGERERIGGHGLRPLCVVAPPGPTEAAVAWTRKFTSWSRVVQGIEAVLARLKQPVH